MLDETTTSTGGAYIQDYTSVLMIQSNIKQLSYAIKKKKKWHQKAEATRKVPMF
jgi:hypothetical protein